MILQVLLIYDYDDPDNKYYSRARPLQWENNQQMVKYNIMGSAMISSKNSPRFSTLGTFSRKLYINVTSPLGS